MDIGALAALFLGVLIGLVIYWLVYRFYWRRWRSYLERDMSYLQQKVKSAEATNFGLERQMTAQKAELAGLRSKISELERDVRQAQARADGVELEKQSLVIHMNNLRLELALYKKSITEAPLATGPLPQRSNGKTHEPPVVVELPESIGAFVSGNGSSGSNGFHNKEAPKITPSNGAAKTIQHSDPVTEPPPIFIRPRSLGDRLEIIQGIGPAIARKLNEAGIDTFEELSMLTAVRLKELVGPRTAKLMDAQSVIDQAKKLVGQRKPGR